MESLKDLTTRFWRTGVLFATGLLVIVYISFGFLYIQQSAQQGEFEKQIAKLSPIVSKPLASAVELRAEYGRVNTALAPMTDQATVGIIVSIVEENGIDIDPDNGMLRIPSAGFKKAKVGGGTYRVVSFGNIRIQGPYDNVMAFLSDLDSGKTLKTMVLTRVVLSDLQVTFSGTEGARRLEFRDVVSAVGDMMVDNGLSTIPNPMSSEGGVATNLMGDDPNTEPTDEGFPNTTTTTAEKGYSGNATPRAGYVLYNHDRIDPDDSTQFNTVDYISVLTTDYYYTCEADGTVHQFDGANIATAVEYLTSEEASVEVVALLNIDIYTKVEEQ